MVNHDDVALPLEEEVQTFDFDQHRRVAEDLYRRVRPRFEAFTMAVERILTMTLQTANIMTTTVQSRTKTVESFGNKAAQSKAEDPESPKYPDPLRQITDLSAVRAITYFLSSVKEADVSVREEFEIIETIDKGALLEQETRLGYQSVHYLVKLSDKRLSLPEYAEFSGFCAEVQVRTILQHAWAEIEHDIQYKSVDALPNEIGRRFLALAGMLEIGDREFQAIANAQVAQENAARTAVESNTLNQVEVTPASLKLFLDREYGEDGRMRDWSYEWTTRLLKRLGFITLEQLAEAIEPYDDVKVSRVIFGNKQGQLTRLEEVLRAAMGDAYLRDHIWNQGDEVSWLEDQHHERIARLERAGISIGAYSPKRSPR